MRSLAQAISELTDEEGNPLVDQWESAMSRVLASPDGRLAFNGLLHAEPPLDSAHSLTADPISAAFIDGRKDVIRFLSRYAATPVPTVQPKTKPKKP